VNLCLRVAKREELVAEDWSETLPSEVDKVVFSMVVIEEVDRTEDSTPPETRTDSAITELLGKDSWQTDVVSSRSLESTLLEGKHKGPYPSTRLQKHLFSRLEDLDMGRQTSAACCSAWWQKGRHLAAELVGESS